MVVRSTRVNLTVPTELLEQVRRDAPGLNLSEALRGALVASIRSCAHNDLECTTCATSVDRRDLIDAALGVFYDKLHERVSELVYQAGTAEGAALVMRGVARDHGVSTADRRPLPRPTRRARQAALDAKLHELDVTPAARRRLRQASA